jgi:tRNA pseudouridine(38-40) synthase
MTRYKLIIEYDGTPYFGWQSQRDGRGVQDAVERALWKMEPDAPRLKCAGRTDAGVHALGQVSHVDLAKDWSAYTLREALNAHLKQADEAVAVVAVEACEERFDCRLWARQRHYRYRILNRPGPSALDRHRVWHIMKPLDVVAMQEAAQSVLGQHDFTTFRASACQSKSRRWSGWRFSAPARKCISRPAHAAFCTIRCARWWAHSCKSGVASGPRAGCARRSTPKTARNAGPWRPHRACILRELITEAGFLAVIARSETTKQSRLPALDCRVGLTPSSQ